MSTLKIYRKGSFVCSICGMIITTAQITPLETAILSISEPFGNIEGWIEHRKTGWCQGRINNKYGKAD